MKTRKGRKPLSKKQVGLRHGFRSGLEDTVHKQIVQKGHTPRYECNTLEYTVPERQANYTPDFLLDNGIFIETKGRFLTADRKKHLHVRASHPGIDIRFVFSNSNAKLYKGSKTTYGDWCRSHRFQYSDKVIPSEWFQEKGNDKAQVRKG